MNRALFFIASFVVSILAVDGVEEAKLAIERCPPCRFNCLDGFHCECGQCVRNTPPSGGIIVDCNHGYSYDYSQRRCVPVTCDAHNACPTGQTCVPERRPCIREPCQQFKCVNTVFCESCAAVLCPANSRCRCGKCEPIDSCRSCATVTCPADTQCRCGQCLPIERSACGRGEEYDSRLHRCVAVSCSADSACPRNQLCVPKKLDCIRAPCPQFECQVRPICARGEEYDTNTKRCVAVSCSAPHPCGPYQYCVPTSVHCLRAPCPQFRCRQRQYHHYPRAELAEADD